ncbi:hypothetical protein [Streptomyces sp. MBT27]|uniref:hypothetical protein n=1 Tax=Streptomyces sp. MBT27 TaxID=1488356 RepID=UPI001421CFC9|nr:hypothetical protein [Streptomyces sp. MBT27]
MGNISIDTKALPRLLTDGSAAHGSSRHGASYQQAFADLAATHLGEPPSRIVPLLRAAADRALLGFTSADLYEQAEAISTGRRYELRITLT